MTTEEYINNAIECVDGMLWIWRGEFVFNAVMVLDVCKKANQIDEFSVFSEFGELQSVRANVRVAYRIGEKSYLNKYQLNETLDGYCELKKYE